MTLEKFLAIKLKKESF